MENNPSNAPELMNPEGICETEFEPISFEVRPVTEADIVTRRRARGRVRWFERSLGYGFIQEDGNIAEIFCHRSNIQVPGMKVLRNGQRVAFELALTKRGPIALNVVPIAEKPEALEKFKAKKIVDASSESTKND